MIYEGRLGREISQNRGLIAPVVEPTPVQKGCDIVKITYREPYENTKVERQSPRQNRFEAKSRG